MSPLSTRLKRRSALLSQNWTDHQRCISSLQGNPGRWLQGVACDRAVLVGVRSWVWMCCSYIGVQRIPCSNGEVLSMILLQDGFGVAAAGHRDCRRSQAAAEGRTGAPLRGAHRCIPLPGSSWQGSHGLHSLLFWQCVDTLATGSCVREANMHARSTPDAILLTCVSPRLHTKQQFVHVCRTRHQWCPSVRPRR